MPLPKLAMTAVMMAANMAMSALRQIEGPRVTDTRATVADYGTPLNYLLGARLLSCPTFFAKPILEKKKKRKGKSGKQVSYSGYGTWAVHVADHALGGVLQVWFDNHLVYDDTGSETEIYPLADDYELESHMRVYLGTEAQAVDPDMEAYIEARDGAGSCPAYRGTSYIYFENVPLEMLGNRYPDVKVLAARGEVTFVPEESAIEYVGGQTYTRENGAAASAIPFALTGGLASTPAADDTVIILSATGGNGDFNPAVSGGYSELTTHLNQGTTGRISAGLWGKRMGATPDTTWSAAGSGVSTNSQVWIVMVFRGVHSDILDGAAVGATYTAATVDPPEFTSALTGATLNPDPICTASGNINTAAFTFALKASAEAEILLVAAGARQHVTTAWTAGSMTTVRFDIAGDSWPASAGMAFGGSVAISDGTTLGDLLNFLAERAGLDDDEYDFTQVMGEAHAFDGFSWTQASGKQVAEAVADLFDADLRPHDFMLEALPRGGASAGDLASDEFALGDSGPFTLAVVAPSDLPRRVFLVFADSDADQEPNTAMPPGPDTEAAGGVHEVSLDMSTLAIDPPTAQQLTERRLRRLRFGAPTAEFTLTRRRIAIEPGDVWTPSFDGEAMTMRCTKWVLGADGHIATEWERDDPAIAALSGAAGAEAAGYVAPAIPGAMASAGDVMDLPLLIDAHDQTAPLAYLAAGPGEPGVWPGADFAVSDTGELDSYLEGWDGIAAGDGAVIGATIGALAEALPWVPDAGSSVTVDINQGELTAATLEELLLDGTRNLAAIESGSGWELVQFMTPTLVGTRQYTIAGFLRGVRGTEHAIAGHAAGDRFVLLDGTVKRRTLGASEIGDTDHYVVSTTGQAVDQDEAFALAFSAASHKPYAPVHGTAVQDGADWIFDATRRTRIGGTTLDGQDVPLGEASESWSLDIMDGAAVVRTIVGATLPLTYTEAEQITDWGSAQVTIDANLYQVSPTLSLRGYPLALAA